MKNLYAPCGVRGRKKMLETQDLVMAKARFEDWRAMYRNVWSRTETARYMAWKVTASEEEARLRMRRTVEYGKTHDSWLVYEKKSGQAIGFAGVAEFAPRMFRDSGIALGPEYVGRGYGTQILQALMDYSASAGGKEFVYSTRADNAASKALALSCGFDYQYSEQKASRHGKEAYRLEVYSRKLGDGACPVF